MHSNTPHCPFAAYRHLLGVERQGIHRFRLWDIAVVDLGLTLLASWIFARILKVSFWWMFVFWMIVGLVLHRLFCVETTLTKWVFGDFNGIKDVKEINRINGSIPQ